jgi:hypothetical protein
MPRITCRSAGAAVLTVCGAMPAARWYEGTGNSALTPPPVAPPLAVWRAAVDVLGEDVAGAAVAGRDEDGDPPDHRVVEGLLDGDGVCVELTVSFGVVALSAAPADGYGAVRWAGLDRRLDGDRLSSAGAWREGVGGGGEVWGGAGAR